MQKAVAVGRLRLRQRRASWPRACGRFGGGGRHEPSSATVVRVDNGATTMSDGPFAETKEHLAGFWVIKCDDLDAALAWAERCRGLLARSRCAPSTTCPGLSRRKPSPDGPSDASTARSTAAASPPWPASSATSTSPRRPSRTPGSPRALAGEQAAAQPRGLDRDDRPQPGHRPAPPGVDPRGPPRPGPAAARTGRTPGGGTGAGRPTATHLHLLPPGARPERAGRRSRSACSAASRCRRSPGRTWSRRRRSRSGSCAPRRRSATPNIPYRVPGDAELPDRLPPVLTVLYLMFNEGYTSTAGDALSATTSAPRRSGSPAILAELMPDEPEVLGLLALLLLTEARRRRAPARRRDGAAPRPGPLAVGPRPHRRGPRARRRCLRRNRPARTRSRPRSTRCTPTRRRRRHRLAAGPAALRPAPRARADPGRRAQPRGRRRRGGRGRRRRSPPSTASTSIRTTCSTPRAICPGRLARPRPGRAMRTNARSEADEQRRRQRALLTQKRAARHRAPIRSRRGSPRRTARGARSCRAALHPGRPHDVDHGQGRGGGASSVETAFGRPQRVRTAPDRRAHVRTSRADRPPWVCGRPAVVRAVVEEGVDVEHDVSLVRRGSEGNGSVGPAFGELGHDVERVSPSRYRGPWPSARARSSGL